MLGRRRLRATSTRSIPMATPRDLMQCTSKLMACIPATSASSYFRRTRCMLTSTRSVLDLARHASLRRSGSAFRRGLRFRCEEYGVVRAKRWKQRHELSSRSGESKLVGRRVRLLCRRERRLGSLAWHVVVRRVQRPQRRRMALSRPVRSVQIGRDRVTYGGASLPWQPLHSPAMIVAVLLPPQAALMAMGAADRVRWFVRR